MAEDVHGIPLTPGLSTGIGSVPHRDPVEAAAFSLRMAAAFPFAPQVPERHPAVAMIPQFAIALPEVTVGPRGEIRIDPTRAGEPFEAVPTRQTHPGLLSFLDACERLDVPPHRVKVQIAGPLTLGAALVDAGVEPRVAFVRAREAAIAWRAAVEGLVNERLPGVPVVTFVDEPGLVLWRGHDGPIEWDEAVDMLSGVLASRRGTTGIHVCGDGDVRLAFEAGTDVLGVTVSPDLVDVADVIARHLDAGGWIAWGAVPSDRPVGESPEPLWRALVHLWCELTRRGCDPMALRTRSVVTPACGLAGHGVAQAERALQLAQAIAQRAADQAVAARLTLGA